MNEIVIRCKTIYSCRIQCFIEKVDVTTIENEK